MTKTALAFILIVAASAANAQSNRQQAAQLMVVSLQSQGFSSDIAAALVPCFLDRLTNRQVRELVAAPDDNARNEVMQGMRDREGANLCAGAVIPE